jgi:protein-S-isoprenylcysteine O-methyltransferase Ste14
MSGVDPIFRLVVVGAAWLNWLLPFGLGHLGPRPQPERIETGARWGIALVFAGYFCAFTHGPTMWRSQFEMWRVLSGTAFAIPAIVLGWWSVKSLGRQLRIDAGLNPDHELVRSGVYRFVRHPIYTSMFGMLLASVCWVGTLPGWPIGIVLFVAGTEIRVRAEEELLRARFGTRFTDWRKSVPAYIPFVH